MVALLFLLIDLLKIDMDDLAVEKPIITVLCGHSPKLLFIYCSIAAGMNKDIGDIWRVRPLCLCIYITFAYMRVSDVCLIVISVTE